MWGPVALSAVTDTTGNITQLYPKWIQYAPGTTVGHALPVPAGGLVRRPSGGRVNQVIVETDGTDGGIIQLFDMSGLDAGADVSSATTITNTQYTTLAGLGRAKLVWEQNFSGSAGSPIVYAWQHGFLRGLAARFVATTGTCNLNISAEGGFQFYITAGIYAGG